MNKENTIKARQITAELIWHIRLYAEINQKQIAKLTDISEGRISKYITRTETPSIESFLSILDLAYKSMQQETVIKILTQCA